MKIYLAASAPGNENMREFGFITFPRRLLSYFLIKKNQFECNDIFKNIIKYKTICNKQSKEQN